MNEDITHRFPEDSFERILARLDSMDSSLSSRLDSLESRMTALEERVDRRLMETRPIWEQVLARLDTIESRLEAIESRLGAVESRLDSLEQRFERIEEEMHDLNQKVRVFVKDVVRLQDFREEMDERVRKLENSPSA